MIFTETKLEGAFIIDLDRKEVLDVLDVDAREVPRATSRYDGEHGVVQLSFGHIPQQDVSCHEAFSATLDMASNVILPNASRRPALGA